MITGVKILALLAAQAEAALAKAQIQRLIERAALFHNGILADNTHITHAVLDIGDNVSRLRQHEFNIGIRQTEDELTGAGTQFADIIAGMLQQLQGLFFQSALGQSDTNNVFWSHACTSTSFTAPSRKITSVR